MVRRVRGYLFKEFSPYFEVAAQRLDGSHALGEEVVEGAVLAGGTTPASIGCGVPGSMARLSPAAPRPKGASRAREGTTAAEPAPARRPRAAASRGAEHRRRRGPGFVAVAFASSPSLAVRVGHGL